MATEVRVQNGGVVAAGPTLPLAFRFQGDFLVHLVTVDAGATADDVCREAAQHVAGKRTAARDGQLAVVHDGAAIPGDRRLADAGVGYMDFVEIVVREAGGPVGGSG